MRKNSSVTGILIEFAVVSAVLAVQRDADEGGWDDAPIMVAQLDIALPSNITQVPDFSVIEVPVLDEKSVAEEWMIQRISLFQQAVVALRNSFQESMRNYGAWSCRWYEVHMPEFFGCITRHYVTIVEEDCQEYPNAILMIIRNVKEVYIKSKLYRTPIKELNKSVFEGTNFFLNGLISDIKRHRKELEELINSKIRDQADTVKITCNVPSMERHLPETATGPDPDYVFSEDYSPQDYNRL